MKNLEIFCTECTYWKVVLKLIHLKETKTGKQQMIHHKCDLFQKDNTEPQSANLQSKQKSQPYMKEKANEFAYKRKFIYM